MAHDDKDRLADLLGQMADGHHDDSAAHPQEARHEARPNEAQGSPSAQPSPPARQPMPKPAATTNLPTPKPTATPPQGPQRAPLPGAAPAGPRKTASPPQPVPAMRPSPGGFAQAPGEPVDEDDAVIVPAPPVSALAHSQAHRHHGRPQAGLSLGLRRTMIPVLLTLGLEMFVLIALGALSPADGTFRMFIQPGIAILLAVLGIVFLPAGLFLMFQVRSELSEKPPQ